VTTILLQTFDYGRQACNISASPVIVVKKYCIYTRVSQRIELKQAVLTYKFLFNQAPRYLEPVNLPDPRPLCSANTDRLSADVSRRRSLSDHWTSYMERSVKHCSVRPITLFPATYQDLSFQTSFWHASEWTLQ